MSNEFENIIEDRVEEMAVDKVEEQVTEERQSAKPRWELWVALSSSLLAVVSAVAALLATFASDEASHAYSYQTDYTAYAEGANASHSVLKSKLDILSALGKPISPEDFAELRRIEDQAREFRERAEMSEEEGEKDMQTHDRLAIAVTLFQVTMLLGGVSVMFQRASVWRFGLLFTVLGAGFLAYGLIGYVG